MLDATPLLRLYSAWRLHRLDHEDAARAQQRELMRLIARGRKTRFGKDHDFHRIASVADYQKRVPLRSFEDFWSDYWATTFPILEDCTWPGRMPFFAETSGTTTGRTKHIPCGREMNSANRTAALDILVHHLRHRPGSRLLGGRNFMLGGSTGMHELAPGVLTGDLSGIAARTMPWWARLRYFPPRHLESIADWEERIHALADAAVDADIRSISGTPSWLLVLFDRLKAAHPDRDARLAAFFPHLEMIVHGAVSFAPYRASFAGWLADSEIETREVYAASEGFVAIADRGDGEGMRLIADKGLFFEFVPVEDLDSAAPTRHWLADAETGINYAIVLSTCAGLWSYVLGDTVELLDRAPPRIRITGRTSFMLSAFGEHLIAVEVENAVTAAAEEIGARIVDYAVGAVFPAGADAKGGHVFVVEFHDAEPGPAARARFIEAVDRRLAETNEDYRAHRAGMLAPRLEVAKPGTFFAWMKRRGQLGGQHKVPRIINDTELLEDLRDFVGEA
jgi:hypothetical protein